MYHSKEWDSDSNKKPVSFVSTHIWKRERREREKEERRGKELCVSGWLVFVTFQSFIMIIVCHLFVLMITLFHRLYTHHERWWKIWWWERERKKEGRKWERWVRRELIGKTNHSNHNSLSLAYWMHCLFFLFLFFLFLFFFSLISDSRVKLFMSILSERCTVWFVLKR